MHCRHVQAEVTASLPSASAASDAGSVGWGGGGNEAQSAWHEAPRAQRPLRLSPQHHLPQQQESAPLHHMRDGDVGPSSALAGDLSASRATTQPAQPQQQHQPSSQPPDGGGSWEQFMDWVSCEAHKNGLHALATAYGCMRLMLLSIEGATPSYVVKHHAGRTLLLVWAFADLCSPLCSIDV